MFDIINKRAALLVVALVVSFSLQAAEPAEEIPLISVEQFNQEWRVHDFPNLLYTEDGTPFFKLNITITLEWVLDSSGKVSEVKVIEQIPDDIDYAPILIDAVKQSRLEAKVEQPTLPARIRGTFEYHSL